MHIYFSGIGGTGIGPLALIAHQAGFAVSGSDAADSQYIQYLKKQGLHDIHIGQTEDAIAAVHEARPIDWLVHSSAITQNHPELRYAASQGIKTTKRDALLNHIIQQKSLKLIAIAGTHGKTTTTAMVIWLFKQLGLPISYSVGAKISFGDMGHFEPQAKYFVYEADEFDRNFLAFEPHISLITGVTWDHHEIFPTRGSYQQAFREFIDQSNHTVLWQEDYEYLGLLPNAQYSVEDSGNPDIHSTKLPGLYNRLDAWLAIQAVHHATHAPIAKLVKYMHSFPGSQRRMEQIAPNLYSDYAHTPEKIRGGMSVATEIAAANNQALFVVYEPLTNRRQHYMQDDYRDCFAGAAHVYWIPSYLAREDPNQRVLTPAELISRLADPSIASAHERDTSLRHIIQTHLKDGDMVVGMAGGGGSSLDEWLRTNFTPTS